MATRKDKERVDVVLEFPAEIIATPQEVYPLFVEKKKKGGEERKTNKSLECQLKY